MICAAGRVVTLPREFTPFVCLFFSVVVARVSAVSTTNARRRCLGFFALGKLQRRGGAEFLIRLAHGSASVGGEDILMSCMAVFV